jgi:hypothetical protein
MKYPGGWSIRVIILGSVSLALWSAMLCSAFTIFHAANLKTKHLPALITPELMKNEQF